eukprot:scaffold1694_cov413-Prasinococcus_capsulatus_cf.AAC.3
MSTGAPGERAGSHSGCGAPAQLVETHLVADERAAARALGVLRHSEPAGQPREQRCVCLPRAALPWSSTHCRKRVTTAAAVHRRREQPRPQRTRCGASHLVSHEHERRLRRRASRQTLQCGHQRLHLARAANSIAVLLILPVAPKAATSMTLAATSPWTVVVLLSRSFACGRGRRLRTSSSSQTQSARSSRSAPFRRCLRLSFRPLLLLPVGLPRRDAPVERRRAHARCKPRVERDVALQLWQHLHHCPFPLRVIAVAVAAGAATTAASVACLREVRERHFAALAVGRGRGEPREACCAAPLGLLAEQPLNEVTSKLTSRHRGAPSGLRARTRFGAPVPEPSSKMRKGLAESCSSARPAPESAAGSSSSRCCLTVRR